MTDERLDQQPTVATLDATTLVTVTQVVSGVRRVRQASADLFKGLDGKSAIATITNTTPANIPAVGATVQYAVDSSTGFAVDQIVAIGGASTLKVVALPTNNSITLENVDATPGTVAAGAKIVPSGKKGTTGATGTAGATGADAFTTVTAQFTIPALNANVTATVGSTAFMSVGMALQIGGVFFRVASIASATQVSLTNTRAGQSGTVAATAKVVAAGEPGPKGDPGSGGGGATGLQYTYTSAAGTASSGQMRSANLAVAGTILINAVDAQGQSAADVLDRLKVGAIIEIAIDLSNRVRGTVTTAYSATTNDFAIGSVASYGTIGSGTTVLLSIISDTPSSGGTSITNALALPPLSADPAADATKSLVFCRANGLPYLRLPDGTVYPLTLGAAVPPIGGGADPLAGVWTEYFTFDTLTGGVAASALTSVGTVSFPNGLVGKAAAFTGAGDAVNSNQPTLVTPDSAALRYTTGSPFAVYAWIKPTTYPSVISVICSKYNGDLPAGPVEYALILLSSGKIRWAVYDQFNNIYTLLPSTASAPTGQWSSVVAWYTPGASASVSISINNGTVDTASVAGGFSDIVPGAASFRVGTLSSTNVFGFDGQIDFVGITKANPTAAQRSAFYNGGLGYAP